MFRICLIWSFPFIYNTDRSNNIDFEYDCIETDVDNGSSLDEQQFTGVSQIIRYCIRPSYRLDDYSSVTETGRKWHRYVETYTFEELHNKFEQNDENILWGHGYTSIDIIERYKLYLNTLNESLSHEKIHRCERPWFGSECQYVFNSLALTSIKLNMDNYFQLEQSMHTRSSDLSVLRMTCYTHIICNRGPPPACLDWREICDGKIDCANDNGIDERFCDQLENFVCSENEYRCNNGRQCIPKEFVKDDPLNPDCQDESDEIPSELRISKTSSDGCDQDPSFRCEERLCSPNELVCGDGQCVEYFNECYNHRGQLLYMEYEIYGDHSKLSSCRTFSTSCDTHILYINDCKKLCWNSKMALCDAKLGQLCASTIFTSSPARFRPNNEMYVFYNYNIAPSKGPWIMVPHDNCFNDTYCEDTEISSDNPAFLWCQRNQRDMHLDYIGSYSRSNLTATIERLNKRCLKTSVGNGNSYQYEKTNTTFYKQSQLNHKMDFPINSNDRYDENLLENNDNEIKLSYENNQNKNISLQINWDEIIIFYKLCDRREKSYTIINNGINETDETECDYWPCNNVYTRCDGHINCPDGNDEANCTMVHCLSNEILCVSVESRTLICLHKGRVWDSEVDCIGGTDGSANCDSNLLHSSSHQFLCPYYNLCIDIDQVCDDTDDCIGWDNEYLCNSHLMKIIEYLLLFHYNPMCIYAHHYQSNVAMDYFTPISFLSLMNLKSYPYANSTESNKTIHLPLSPERQKISNSLVASDETVKISEDKSSFYCHRGLEAYSVSLSNKKLYKRVCFCPPGYYGNQCQYQSDRVSLTLRFRLSINQQSVSNFLITLRDDEHRINSFIIIDYHASIVCDTKFNNYLLYSSPMKDKKKKYFIHIDLIKQDDLSYYASWYFPIRNYFLPVTRISSLIQSPPESILPTKKSYCNNQCNQGQCIKYVNTEMYYCQCKPDWYGRLCDIKQDCNCSFGSLCAGFVNDQPICICPSGKFGSYCLFESLCAATFCQNGGTCIRVRNHKRSKYINDHRCVCTNEFDGANCETRKNAISLRFVGIQTYSLMIIHILSDFTFEFHTQNTIFEKLRMKSQIVNVFISSTINLNLLFVQFDEIYYLAVVQDDGKKSVNISTVISRQRQCYYINDLLNSTIIQYHLLRRLKYYPKLCSDYPDLVCFHDKRLMCLCTQDRFSNCFKFNFTRTLTCYHTNPCEKYGRCVADRPQCPLITQCICQECYYGTRCQFSTVGLGVSLDAMIGYEIHPEKSLLEQPRSVQITAIITLVVFIFGLISNILSLITFQQQGQACTVGCGRYLLTLSATSLLTIIMFTLKYCFLLLIQMSIITNRNFLYISCLSVDMLTQVCLTTSNWLGAAVAIERTVSAIQQAKFNKRKSRQIVVWIVAAIIICVITTHLSDPLYRTLIKDDDEQRMWCIVRYSSSLERFSSINLIIHFVTPFSINAITAIIIIIVKTSSVFNLKKEQTYLQHLLKQFRQFRHLLISPTVLVLLSIPRLILAFLPGCMKSNEDLWIYLTGYFISFVPPLLTFPIFVLPSRLYRNEFTNQTKRLFGRVKRLYTRNGL